VRAKYRYFAEPFPQVVVDLKQACNTAQTPSRTS
jgi:hypothetical protein